MLLVPPKSPGMGMRETRGWSALVGFALSISSLIYKEQLLHLASSGEKSRMKFLNVRDSEGSLHNSGSLHPQQWFRMQN